MVGQVTLAKEVQAQFQQEIRNNQGNEAKIAEITETAKDIIDQLSNHCSGKEFNQIEGIKKQMFRGSVSVPTQAPSVKFPLKKDLKVEAQRESQAPSGKTSKATKVRYKTFPIIPDGNCCFRSMSHSLVRTVHENPAILKDIKAQRDLLVNSGLHKVAADLTKYINLLERCKGSPIPTERDSNLLAAQLRKLACTWNESLDLKTWGLSPDHVQKMKKDKEWGTGIEIQAIVSAMGIRANIICGDGSLSTQGEKGPVAITVVHKESHYSEALIH